MRVPLDDSPILLGTEEETLALGAELVRFFCPGMTVHLKGPLGAGKTTLVRGFLQALGHSGPVRSPTYSLVETYTPGQRRVHHFDLYRLASPEELEWMGIRDYLSADALTLIEWAERGQGILPPPDATVTLAYEGPARTARLRRS